MDRVCFNCFRNCEREFCPFCGYKNGKSLESYPLALPEGSVLNGRYIVGRVLGQGGFGITYVAQDYNTKSLVAIKEFFPDSLVTRTSKVSVSTISADRRENFNYGKECFLKEAETLSHFIGHPNIVTIYSYFEENNTAYLAMEYLDGESFLDYLKRRGRISWEETRKICEPVMDALAFVHSKGLIHRDISPDNIFLCKDGTVKLIDFGAARYSLGDRSQSLSVVLKHGFAPMEQYTRRGHQGPYTDIYALAATMYRSVTGKVPPEAPDRMYDDELKPPTSLGADMPARDEEALLKALAFNYNDRWQTVGEFRSALSEKTQAVPETVYAEDDEITESDYEAEMQSYIEKEKKRRRKNRLIILSVILVAGLLIGLFTWRPWQPFDYKINGNEVTITDYRFKNNQSVDIPSEINGHPVTEIGYDSFSGSQLTSVTIPDSVTSIGHSAFKCCDNLTSVTIPDSVKSIGNEAFAYCKSITNLKIPNGTTTIEDNAFSNCSGLKSVTIPDSVTSIGDSAFNGCTSLTNVIIPKSITNIEDSVFRDCTNLTSVTIPDGVEIIGDCAFENCEYLRDITFPDSVKSIGFMSFNGCGLTEVNLPRGCEVGDLAFCDFDEEIKITYR